MIQTLTLKEIYRIFQKTDVLDKLAFSTFKLLKPWNLIKAYRETCLCRVCEIFRLYTEGLHEVAKLLEPLVAPCGDREDAGDDGDDEDMEVAEMATAAASDPELVAITKFCAHSEKSNMVKDMICGDCLDNAEMKCVEGTCGLCGFAKIWSKGLRPKLIGDDKQLRDGVAGVWEQTMRWETLKSGGSTPSNGSNSDEKDTLRAQVTGTIIEFLDAFEAASVKFPAHRHLIADAKAKALRRSRYFWPGMLLSDYDWSENGVINPKYQIQSEYWSLTHYSLFISITSYLVVHAWLDRCSLLSVRTEVTVEPEGAPANTLQPAKGSYWAVIHASPMCEGNKEIYSVQCEDGSVIGGITRERLRHRKKHTTAFVGVTDEKRHDACTTQHMLNKQFEHWRLHLDEVKLWAWLGHSDNASHFKSGPMLHYWSGKMSQLDFLIKACWIEFGCPGHGKGPWDGMGAVVKQRVARDMTNGRVLTASGVIESPREVAEHLQARFMTDEWKAEHADKAIHEIIVTYSHHNEITERPAVEHEFESLTGKMNSFSFMTLAPDTIARRERSCWCEACFRQLGRATLKAKGTELICEGCSSPNPLPWHEQTVKDLGTGIAGRRKEAQGLGAQLAPRLTASGFFAVQARERWSLQEDLLYRPGHYWVAQAPDVLEVRKIDRRQTINGTSFSSGDYMIRVGRYFDRDASDDSGLTFEDWQPELVFTPSDVSGQLFNDHPPLILLYSSQLTLPLARRSRASSPSQREVMSKLAAKLEKMCFGTMWSHQC